MRLRLNEIERAIGGSIIYKNAKDTDYVSCVEIDSRLVERDGVFIAAVGEKVDGHKFIGDVFGRGAKLVISAKTPEEVEREHGISPSEWGSYIVVEEPYEALRAIAEFYRETLRIPVVGITGSVGKTSTKEFIAGVLSERYKVLKTDGNLNNNIDPYWQKVNMGP